jgi:ubiquinone/menaquinone biosynthesis C-methylase UbiE
MYVYERLNEIASKDGTHNFRILDAGSGLTFFPHYVVNSHSNLTIDCCDYDSQLQVDAGKLITPTAQAVSYSFQDISALTYSNAIFDVIYCISVLEHCDHYDEILAGFARVLKPGGRLILTIDISLDGESDIPLGEATRLIEHLSKRFVPDSDYLSMVNNYDKSQILTTEHIREVDPNLLPWKQPDWRTLLRHLLRHGRILKTPFNSLSCFCMSWTISS